MIPNLLNTLIGLWLAYVAIFPGTEAVGKKLTMPGAGAPTAGLVAAHSPHFAELLVAAVATVVLALWARRSDVSHWQSNSTIVAAVVLAIVVILDRLWTLSSVLMFWVVLWVGLVSATLSLWAALDRPGAMAQPD